MSKTEELDTIGINDVAVLILMAMMLIEINRRC